MSLVILTGNLLNKFVLAGDIFHSALLVAEQAKGKLIADLSDSAIYLSAHVPMGIVYHVEIRLQNKAPCRP